MALAPYAKATTKNVGGNFNKLFFTEIANITSVTGGTELTAVTMVGATKFQMVTAEIDSVQMKIEGSGNSNYFNTQTLVMRFAKRSASLTAFINSLTDAVACGVAAIRIDGNGIAWLSGFDEQGVDKWARPYNKIKVTHDSGVKPSDENQNSVIIELSRETEYDEIPFTSTVSGYMASQSGSAGWCAYT